MSDGSDCLTRAGPRAALPRLAVWRVLCNADGEPDAVELLRRASTIEPRTSLGTVYWFLRELEQRGLSRITVCVGMPPLPARRLPRPHLSSPEMLAAVTRLVAGSGYQRVPVNANRPFAA